MDREERPITEEARSIRRERAVGPQHESVPGDGPAPAAVLSGAAVVPFPGGPPRDPGSRTKRDDGRGLNPFGPGGLRSLAKSRCRHRQKKNGSIREVW